MVNILFVCTGDTCRSSMASSILKEKILKKNIRGIACSSAGLFVTHEIKMHENAKKALQRIGVNPARHTATQLTLALIGEYKYVLTMTTEQKQTILNKYPHLKNVFSIKEFVLADDILDPYGKGESIYVSVAKYLELVCDEIIKKLRIQGEI